MEQRGIMMTCPVTSFTGFYEKCGFRVSSEEFPEDGIPHREMTLSFDSPKKD